MLTKEKNKSRSTFIIGAGSSINKHNLSSLEEASCIFVNRSVFLLDSYKFKNWAWCYNDFCTLDEFSSYNKKYDPFYERTVVGLETNMRPLWKKNYGAFTQAGGSFRYTVPFDTSKNVEDGWFSDNILDRTYCGFNIVIDLAIPLAMWWGSSTIYLLGCDCDDKGHFYDNDKQHKVRKKFKLANIKKVFRGYEVVNTFAKEKGVSILNAGIGGNLAVFPRTTIVR